MVFLWQSKIGDRNPTLDDRSKTHYIEATILEIMRHCPHLALTIPHFTSGNTFKTRWLGLQGLAKMRALVGCVNSASCLPLAAGGKFTQPRAILLADPPVQEDVFSGQIATLKEVSTVQSREKVLVRGCEKILSCLTFLPGPAWVLLSKICKDFFSALYSNL